METRVGFIGLGIMGRPMASHLLRSGVPLSVWNRSAGASGALQALGATVADSPADVFGVSDVVLLMLAHESAIDEVLQRGTAQFADMVSGRTVVHLGTTSPDYSAALGGDVEAAGGDYVEAPVSGSRVPAERGELVALTAGRPAVLDRVEPLLAPFCREVLRCGAVPSGTGTKLAVNLYLCTMVAGLAEAYHLAIALGLDPGAFQRALDAGPMASAVSTLKLAMLVERDFETQAAIRDVHRNTRLVAHAARAVGAVSPLLDVTRELFRETEDLGSGALDMAAVVTALERRDGIGTATRRAAARC
ncbi:NAD(P)-dependent oxidoreductase [Terrabacter aerolatus]|uniref:2-hydroxy-3-oxopropionate reductase n=1 Tax=Terrabacter aerolatus TaxID=422442 RepID=A0A512CXL0_9MICO|nr:NAD(P)-dependent oxidoreductase [Terrabacter aerolatus]GEO28750.1 2-hydroxy-3-oxopropionate reductase [Terrabacter aerolatus]